MHESLTRDFIRLVPKTDLHVHLDGSLRVGTLIEFAKSGGIELPSYEEAGLKERVFKDTYANLPEYLEGFRYTVAVLQNPENIERVAYELAADNLAEGVRYIEVRFAPQLHMSAQFPIEDVVGSVCRGLDRAKDEHNRTAGVQDGTDIPFAFGIIVCALRYFNKDMSPYYAKLFNVMANTPEREIFSTASVDLARAAFTLIEEKGLPIVGFDLAGAEAGYPAEDHKRAFRYAHSHFIRKTVHAGEAYGPESIYQAITECQANRIGHGTLLFAADSVDGTHVEDKNVYVERLAQYIASQRITIEACVTSNLQTIPGLRTVAEHPIRRMIENNLSVSVCTDNRLVSNTSVTRELELIASAIPITRSEFRNLIVAGFKGSFYPGRYNDKRAYVRRVIDRYEELEEELLGPEEEKNG